MANPFPVSPGQRLHSASALIFGVVSGSPVAARNGRLAAWQARARLSGAVRLGDAGEMSSAEFTNAHPALAEFWHPVALSSEVGPEPVAVRLAGQGWALARFGGAVAAFADACPHRRARLSAGQVSDGTLQCAYHGWRFAADGRCVEIPALGDAGSIAERARLRRPARVAERDGLVWLAPMPPRAPLPELRPRAGLGGAGIATVVLPVVRVEAN